MALTQQQYDLVLEGKGYSNAVSNLATALDALLAEVARRSNPDAGENPMGQDWTAQRLKELYGPGYDDFRASLTTALGTLDTWYGGL